jgi:Patatin-like phospholipase
MPEISINNDQLHLGLCMAGAVSAGAYTAGVMDYLLEALQEWQKRKEENVPDTPQHQVVIPVIGGASAGGMTGMVTAALINSTITPVKEALPDIMQERPENKLYHSWVDLLGVDMFPMMLNTDDLQDKQIISLLNSSFIDKIADRIIRPEGEWKPPPPYFHSHLKLFTTLTNLKGFGYNIAFKGGATPEKYYMAIHNDYACFKIMNSAVNSSSKPDEEDGWMLLDFKNNINIKTAKDAAMATGAFPVGLKSRELKRTAEHINKIPWFREVTKYFPVKEDDCTTLNVDGGVINNEPFEKVRQVLNELTGEDDEQCNDELKFKSTVLMIDPFPSKEPGEFKRSQKLFDVMGLTFNAMIEQMRAKPAILADAMDANRCGQFLIAPSRRVPKLDGGVDDVAGDKAIACGALSGFSGFLNKEFRIHDYFLGRYNCEIFLRDYFTVSAEALEANPIFRKGYADINKDAFESKRKSGQYQIIPIFSPHPLENTLPVPVFSSGKNWPVLSEKDIDRFRPYMKKRVQKLMLNAVKLKGLTKFLVWIGTKVVLNRLLTNIAMNTIKKSLNEYQLLPLQQSIKTEVVES